MGFPGKKHKAAAQNTTDTEAAETTTIAAHEPDAVDKLIAEYQSMNHIVTREEAQSILNAAKDDEQRRSACFNIGKDGTVKEFRDANQTANKKVIKYRDYIYEDMRDFTGDNAAQQQLFNGAVQAFKDGHPENIQTVFTNLDEFKEIDKPRTESAMFSMNLGRDFVVDTLKRLTQDSDRPSDIIDLALADVPEQDRQALLNSALRHCVGSNFNGDKTFIAALLQSGANANAEFGDFKGLILGDAVMTGKSQPIVEMLLENGANFNDTLFTMQAQGYKEESINKLRLYRDRITNDPASQETTAALLEKFRLQEETIAQQGKTIEQLRETMAELVERLPAQAQTAAVITTTAQAPAAANQSQMRTASQALAR